MDNKLRYQKNALITIITILGGIIFYKSLPFLSGFLGACTVYMMVRNQMVYLTEKRSIRKNISTILILVEVILCFLVPLGLVMWLLTNRIAKVDLDPSSVIHNMEEFVQLIHNRLGYDLLSAENLTVITKRGTILLQQLLNQVSSFGINSIVLLFVLYFMLLGGRRMESYVYDILPFSETHKLEVLNSVKTLIRSNAIGIPLLAVVQGSIAMLGYLIFETPDPVLFGFITCFATIIPLLGTALVWFPLALYLVLTKDVVNGVGLAIYSLAIISNVDNVIRFMLQKKLADTHPLITIFGVIIGLTLFGFWGVIFGPLMLSLFILCFDIFKKEYIDQRP